MPNSIDDSRAATWRIGSNGSAEVVRDPQVEHLGLIVPVADAHGASRSVRPPVQFGGHREGSVRAAPLLNEHGDSIRAAIARGEEWPTRRSEMDVRHREQ